MQSKTNSDAQKLKALTEYYEHLEKTVEFVRENFSPHGTLTHENEKKRTVAGNVKPIKVVLTFTKGSADREIGIKIYKKKEGDDDIYEQQVWSVGPDEELVHPLRPTLTRAKKTLEDNLWRSRFLKHPAAVELPMMSPPISNYEYMLKVSKTMTIQIELPPGKYLLEGTDIFSDGWDGDAELDIKLDGAQENLVSNFKVPKKDSAKGLDGVAAYAIFEVNEGQADAIAAKAAEDKKAAEAAAAAAKKKEEEDRKKKEKEEAAAAAAAAASDTIEGQFDNEQGRTIAMTLTKGTADRELGISIFKYKGDVIDKNTFWGQYYTITKYNYEQVRPRPGDDRVIADKAEDRKWYERFFKKSVDPNQKNDHEQLAKDFANKPNGTKITIKIRLPPGKYSLKGSDSYSDGWDGAAKLDIKLDGAPPTQENLVSNFKVPKKQEPSVDFIVPPKKNAPVDIYFEWKATRPSYESKGQQPEFEITAVEGRSLVNRETVLADTGRAPSKEIKELREKKKLPFLEMYPWKSGKLGSTPPNNVVDDGITRYTIRLPPFYNATTDELQRYRLIGRWNGSREEEGSPNNATGWPGELTIKNLKGQTLLNSWSPPSNKEYGVVYFDVIAP